MKGKNARLLRRLSQFKPHEQRHYHQFNNSHNYILDENGKMVRGPGTVIEVTKDGEATTKRAKYNLLKEKLYGRTF
mgnify:FL=1